VVLKPESKNTVKVVTKKENGLILIKDKIGTERVAYQVIDKLSREKGGQCRLAASILGVENCGKGKIAIDGKEYVDIPSNEQLHAFKQIASEGQEVMAWAIMFYTPKTRRIWSEIAFSIEEYVGNDVIEKMVNGIPYSDGNNIAQKNQLLWMGRRMIWNWEDVYMEAIETSTCGETWSGRYFTTGYTNNEQNVEAQNGYIFMKQICREGDRWEQCEDRDERCEKEDSFLGKDFNTAKRIKWECATQTRRCTLIPASFDISTAEKCKLQF
jgi:hypothetical protein